MNRMGASRQIAALKAIIQTMMPEFYLMQSDGSPKENFFESLEKDEAIAMAISNEFTESGNRGCVRIDEDGRRRGEAELRATPVTPFLKRGANREAAAAAREHGPKMLAGEPRKHDRPGAVARPRVLPGTPSLPSV